MKNGEVDVEYVQGDKQKADILTKALGRNERLHWHEGRGAVKL